MISRSVNPTTAKTMIVTMKATGRFICNASRLKPIKGRSNTLTAYLSHG